MPGDETVLPEGFRPPTTCELIDGAVDSCRAYQELIAANPAPDPPALDAPAAAREFALAITHLEDARMRFTRGLAMLRGQHAPVDLELDDNQEDDEDDGSGEG